MTAAVLSVFALGSTWYTPGTTTTPLKMQDINGTALSVGQTVKIIGKITAITPGADHFDNITVQVSNPSGSAASNPAGQLVLNVHPLNLAVGS